MRYFIESMARSKDLFNQSNWSQIKIKLNWLVDIFTIGILYSIIKGLKASLTNQTEHWVADNDQIKYLYKIYMYVYVYINTLTIF